MAWLTHLALSNRQELVRRRWRASALQTARSPLRLQMEDPSRSVDGLWADPGTGHSALRGADSCAPMAGVQRAWRKPRKRTSSPIYAVPRTTSGEWMCGMPS